VGKDGNVYRKNESGWSKYENGAWNPVKGGGSASQLPAQSGTREQRAGGVAAAGAAPSTGDRMYSAGGQPIRGSSGRDPVMNDLNRESANRAAGQQRTNQWNQEYGSRSGGYSAQRSAPSGGGMRGGGGGMRGGGGRR